MTYLEFNEEVLRFYLSRANSTFLNLSIDKYEIEQIIEINEIQRFTELREDWGKLMQTNAEQPTYIGLLAVQCLAASLMQDDEIRTAAAYLVRLQHILQIHDTQDLNILFRGFSDSFRSQDRLWASAVSYFYKCHGLTVVIPSLKHSTWRYVRYPKSQMLFNTDDLKDFTLFLAEEFQLKERVSFSFFRQRLLAYIPNIETSQRVKKLFLDDNLEALCAQQLYNFYSTWDGIIYRTSVGKKPSTYPQAKGVILYKRLTLSFEKDQPLFYIPSVSESPIPFDDLFHIPAYKYIYGGIILFNYLDEYELDDNRFLYVGETSFILLKRGSNPKIWSYLNSKSVDQIMLSQDLFLLKYTPTDADSRGPLQSFLQTAHPISIKGGIKVERTQTYIQGWGPSVQSSMPFNILCDSRSIYYNPEEATPGVYKIRMDGYQDIEFSIVQKPSLSTSILSKGKGWDLSTLKSSTVYSLEGAITNNSLNNPDSSIKSWLRLNRSFNASFRNNKYKNPNILLKMINNSRL